MHPYWSVMFDRELISRHTSTVCHPDVIRWSLQSNFINGPHSRARTCWERALIPGTSISDWAEPRAFLCQLQAFNSSAAWASPADRSELISSPGRSKRWFSSEVSSCLKIIHSFDDRARFSLSGPPCRKSPGRVFKPLALICYTLAY